MARVPGPSLDQLDALADDYAGLMALTLAQVANVVGASSVESLPTLRTAWGNGVEERLLPALGVGFEVGAATIRVGLREATGLTASGGEPGPTSSSPRASLPQASALPRYVVGDEPGRYRAEAESGPRNSRPDHLTAATWTDVPATSDALSEAYLAQARNRLVGVGDELWGHAREELLEGLRAGESVPELAARVRKVAPDLTEPRATVIARTEVQAAVVAGAYEQVLATGMTGTKTWLATDDSRTRHSHDLADNDTVGLREHFTVGEFPMLRPHDPAAPPHETISCRCDLAYDLDLDAVGTAPPPSPTAAEVPLIGRESQQRDRSFLARVFSDGLAALVGWFKARTAAAIIDHTFESEGGTVTADASQPVEHFHYRMAEGVSTGLRTFASGAITWREPPFAFMWQKMIPESGGHGLAVQAGLITRAERSGEQVDFYGPLDLNSDDGLEYARRLVEGFARWGSVSPDENKVDVEVVWADGTSEEDMALGAEPEQYVFHSFNVAELTALSVPALADATIEPTPALLEELERRGALPAGVKVARSAPVALAAAGGNGSDPPLLDDYRPPAEWFADPQLSEPTGIVVEDDGSVPGLDWRRIYGHAALSTSCHIGFADQCVSPPHEADHPYFLTGEVVTADGGRVAVGQVTLGTGHAPLTYGAQRAAEHYDDTGSVVADVTCGNDEHGIWVAGAIRPGVEPSRVHELRASGQLSGDWRRIGGQLRLVGLLAVNVPGFPVPRPRARVASGDPQALVAAGKVEHGAGHERPDLSRVKELIASKIQRDRPSRRELAAARVKARG